ncbi:hypothetical protein [Streptococcus oralis]|uniref:Uncharacterized protein n=1 Tax=Streptococcus oralis subsp. tigurinus TaxID=1077464 RepID=A0A1X1GDZ7_STROR|nr:hypothetical protein [Streptococcus oralis]ORO44973.1 hypothetical protein B7727_00725 [Streptococcus oralis subsp. tigurinus]
MENIYLGLACFTFVLACGIFFLLVFIYFRINSLELKLKKVSRNFDDLAKGNGCLLGRYNEVLEGSSKNYDWELESLSRKCDWIVDRLSEHYSSIIELEARIKK